MFDRDEPTREKEVYLSVRATDNGKPHLDDVCTIKVTIQDENDNSPVFDKVVSLIYYIRIKWYDIVRSRHGGVDGWVGCAVVGTVTNNPPPTATANPMRVWLQY